MKPRVAIVGRPNVGKSTLFNRLAGRRLALVEDVPGVTRDRHYADAEWSGRQFRLIDTGGFVPGDEDDLLTQIREQAQLAVEECNVIIFLVDGRAGRTAADEAVAELLRKAGKPVFVGVNKLDTPKLADEELAEFYELGFDDTFALSAEHGLGSDPLLDAIVEKLPESDEPEAPSDPEGAVRLAIVGRPNVGKSTLINALLKEKRVVASNIPGTTRDPIDAELDFKGRHFIVTDTAGIRRKKAIAQRLEKFSVLAALKVLERSDVAVLLMDATEPHVVQDAKIAALAQEMGRALVIVVNKWDLIEKDAAKEAAFREELKHELKFVSYAPVIFTSALTGKKVEKVLEVAAALFDQFHFRAPTPMLNKLLGHMTDNHPMPVVDGKPLKLYYIAQVTSAPPGFALTGNKPAGIPDSYKRYITNQLRETFNLKVPILLYFRGRPGQAKRAARKNPHKARR